MKKILILLSLISLVVINCKEKKKILYNWVEGTRVRSVPDLKEESFYSLEEFESVLWGGEKSENKIEITLRGKKLNTHFYKVELNDGKEGWVYAGALVAEKPDVNQYKKKILQPENCGSFSKYVLKNFVQIKQSEVSEFACDDETCRRESYFFPNGITLVESYGPKSVDVVLNFPDFSVKEIYSFASQCVTPFKRMGEYPPPESVNENDDHKLLIKKTGDDISEIMHEYLGETISRYIVKKEKDGSVSLIYAQED